MNPKHVPDEIKKKCRWCGETRPETEYYITSSLNRDTVCKECRKARQRQYYIDNKDIVLQRSRKYESTTRGIETRRRLSKKWRANHRDYFVEYRKEMFKDDILRKAYTTYKNALHRKKIFAADTCERCGIKCKTHGHHKDYLKPLDVEWLCVKCHMKEHHSKEARCG